MLCFLNIFTELNKYELQYYTYYSKLSHKNGINYERKQLKISLLLESLVF